MVQLFILLINLSLVFGGLINLEDTGMFERWRKIRNIFVSTTFTIFLLIFVFVFKRLIWELNRCFPVFYSKERKRILILSSSIIFSIVTRIIFSILYSVDPINDYFYHNGDYDTWFWAVAQFITLSLNYILPMSAMLFSLRHSMVQKQY
jgi:hypothetical protein